MVGVDFGSSALKVVEIVQTDDKMMLRRAAVIPMDSQQEKGALLKQALHDLEITTNYASLGVASPEAVVRPFQFPKMPNKELAGAVQLEAEQAILNGHSPAEMAIDWHRLRAAEDSIRGLLAVIPRTLIDHQVRWVKDAGLTPLVVDVQGLALWNAYWILQGKHESAVQTVLLINIGSRITNFVIARGPDELMLVRDVEIGAEAIGKGRMNDWVSEIHDSLTYARSKGGLREINTAALTGGGGSEEILKTLQSLLGVPVIFWNPLDRMACPTNGHSPDPSWGPRLGVAVGLALRKAT